MSDEIWLPLAGYDNPYEVSDLGRVRVGDQILSQRLWGKYPAVNLRRDSKILSRQVHCLVAEAFIGPRPPGLVIRHLDGTKDNNVPSNLAYGTHKENMQDKVRHGTNTGSRKAGPSTLAERNRMTAQSVFVSVHDAAALLGVSHDTVERIINDGVLPAVRVRGQIRIHEDDLNEYIQGNPVVPGRQSKCVQFFEDRLNAVALRPAASN